ncbi:fungal-specific transcription factor domain-containing protein [Cadophora sp. MPI-SDFR-AT-0126]|nr:fungal-specific transcription factor domain-containing protein [Leotiomycetes sp. MPI-SDFR-AT-0126]
MSETVPLATPTEMNSTSDIFSPYITLSGSPLQFNDDTSATKTIDVSHSRLNATSNGLPIPSNTPQKDQADPASSPPRKRRKGGKIFSGCSTCRQRKMKCDQRRPVCSNCARSRLYVCRGFEDDSIPGKSTETPRPQPQSRPRPKDIHLPKPPVSGLQDEISNFTTEMNSLSPFFFQDDISLGFNSSFIPATLQQQQQQQSSRALYGNQLEAPLAPSDIPSFLDDVSFWDQLLDSNETTQQDTQQTRDLLHLPSLSRVPSPLSSLRHPHSLSISPSLPNLNNLPAPLSELVHHYRTVVSQQMMPTCSPSQNPWLQLYLPLALQEPRTEPKQVLLHAILAVSAFSRAGLASGEGEKYRLQGVQHGEEAVRRLRKAIDEGKGNWPGKGKEKKEMDPVDKQALLAAALTISTIDVWSGANKGTGYIYLRMAKEVIHMTGGISWWLSAAPPTMTIFQIFRCYNIIASTTSWPSPQEQNRNSDGFLLEENHEDDPTASSPSMVGRGADSSPSHSPDSNPESESPSSPNQAHHQHNQDNTSSSPSLDIHHALTHPSTTHYTLDISFGIAMKTLWCLNKTVSLSTTYASFPPGETWSASQLQEIQELQNELDFPLRNPEAFRASISNSGSERRDGGAYGWEGGVSGGGGGISQMVTDEIKENHVWAFHYSVILFFRRSLSHTLPSSLLSSTSTTSHTSITSQTLIHHTLTHLENIDALTPSLPISNTLWPAFIASAEAISTSLRHRSLAWFVRARRHGIGNIGEAKKLVMEVWRREDRGRYVVEEREGERGLQGGLGVVDWRKVMREVGVWVMLT